MLNNNIVQFQNVVAAIMIEYSHNNLITNNDIHNTHPYGAPIENPAIIIEFSHNTIISNNFLKDESYASKWKSTFTISVKDSNNSTLSENEIVSGGIYFEASSNNSISDNLISSGTGIRLDNSLYNIISHNQIFNHTEYGIYLQNSSYNTINQNKMDYFGITLMDMRMDNLINLEAINNTIYGKTIFFGTDLSSYTIPENCTQIILGNSDSIRIHNAKFDGIHTPLIVYNSSKVLITDNKILNSWMGIQLIDITSGQVTSNQLRNIEFEGITLTSSVNIDITKNVFDVVDLPLNYAIRLDQSFGNKISWNDIYSDAYSTTPLNEFKFNYWDGWTEPDENFDCIVDLSYPIKGASIYDRAPLTHPIAKTSLDNAFCRYRAVSSAFMKENQTPISIISIIVVLLLTYQIVRKFRERRNKPKI
jgi:parallel beta-helix repeat protein